MGNPLDGEIRFSHEDIEYTLVFDEEAIAWFEDTTDLSIFEVAAQMEEAEETGKPPKFSTLGSLIAAGLQRHHPGSDRATGMRLMRHPEVHEQLGLAMRAALPTESKEGGDGAASENPPKARAARTRKQTGKPSRKPRSKRG